MNWNDFWIRLIQMVFFLQFIALVSAQDDEGGGDDGVNAAHGPTLNFGQPLPVTHGIDDLPPTDFNQFPFQKKNCTIS